MREWYLPCCFGGVLLLLCPLARAADTVESFDVGVSDLEFYGGFDGIGPDGVDRAQYGNLVLGVGIVEGFSAYVGTTLQANEHFAEGVAGLGVGVFGTPLDSSHVDLDLILDVGLAGPGFDEFELSPGAELNLDVTPDQGTLGFYLRIGVPISGRPVSDEAEGEFQPAFAVALEPGVYVSLGDRHQLLLEYDMALHQRIDPEERSSEIGGLALGYNVALSESFELINQACLDIPQVDERASVGVMVGFVATLPTPTRDRFFADRQDAATADVEEQRWPTPPGDDAQPSPR